MSIIIGLIADLAALILCFKYAKLRGKKENEYYTDYVHNNLVLRVFKPEFEYEAVGKIPIDKILDRGTLSRFYDWCLIEK